MMGDFPGKLSALVALEMSEADADGKALVLERLLHAAAFTISIIARGDAKTTDKLLMGADSYLTEMATGFAPFGKIMEGDN
jgi:hypothetical protein